MESWPPDCSRGLAWHPLPEVDVLGVTKLARSMAISGASASAMSVAKLGGKMLTATTTVTQTVELSPQLKRQLLNELRAYQGLKSQQDALELAIDNKKANIGRLREKSGEKALELEGYKISLVEPVRKELDKKRFVELGWSLAMLENATVSRPTKSYEKISLPG